MSAMHSCRLIKNDGDILRVISTYAYDLNIDMAVFLKYPQKYRMNLSGSLKPSILNQNNVRAGTEIVVVIFRSSKPGEAMLNILGQNTSGQTINNNFEV